MSFDILPAIVNKAARPYSLHPFDVKLLSDAFEVLYEVLVLASSKLEGKLDNS